VADPARGVGKGVAPNENLAPPGRKFKTIMVNESLPSLYPVNIFFVNMRNSLFRFLILFDVFDELQIIY